MAGAVNFALAAAHADTSLIDPAAAQRILAQSGGDARRYMALRHQWMAGKVASDFRAARRAGAWQQRNEGLNSLVAQLAPSGQGANQ